MFFCCPFSCTGKHDGSISYNNMEHELCQPEQREFSEFKGNYSTQGEDFSTAEKFAMHQAYGTIKFSQFQPFFLYRFICCMAKNQTSSETFSAIVSGLCQLSVT